MSFSAAANQFFDRLLTPPNGARATLYAALIDSLVADSTWAKLDALYVYAAADAGTSLINLKSSSFQGFLDMGTGFPTFTANSGWKDCGAPGVKDVNTTFNPSTAAGNYTQNDAMFAIWTIGTTQEDRTALSDTTASSKTELWPLFHDGKTYWDINGDGTEIATANATDQHGFWLVQRTASNACALYRDNVLQASSSNASAAMVNANLIVTQLADTTAVCVIGASLSSGQRTTLTGALQTYLHAIGLV